MKDLLKGIIDKAKAEGAEVHIIKVDKDEKVKFIKDEPNKQKELALEIAQANKDLYDAHLEVGFDEADALDLTIAIITNNNF